MGFVIKQCEEPLLAAGKSVTTLLHKADDRNVLLLLSGGSAANVLNHIDIPNPVSTTIGLVDERFTIDPKHQNMALIEEYEAVRDALDKGITVVPILQQDLTLNECVLAYESFLRSWRKQNPYGAVFVILGVGEDAHTAGIFPYPESEPEFHALFENGAWVTGYDVGAKSENPLRITVTKTFLTNEVDAAIVYATGESKKEALMHLLLPFGHVHKTPVKLLKELKRAFIYTDLLL